MERNLLSVYLINRQIFLNASRIFASAIEILVSTNFDIVSLIPLLILASLFFYRSKKELSTSLS
ncbi:hypothetical protein V6M85_03365 [Sulfolobus tengchongensis]|uniref:Uncharacterized protein n=1 Tax=Sulfolobus tengchongensis TaxID=207809 RepID=A0AAX4L2M3_9CREN